MPLDVVVASPESYFVDDAVEQCENCGCRVYLRPHSQPLLGERRRVVCISCIRGTVGPDDDIEFTPETIEELRAMGRSSDEIERIRKRIAGELKKKP